MHARLTLLLLVLLVACGDTRRTTVTPPPAPTAPAIGELLTAPGPGPVRTFGYLWITPDGAALLDGLSLTATGAPTPLDAGGLWLDELPPLPAEPPLSTAGPVRYGIVAATGTLDGPGQFGPGGTFRYRLLSPALEPLGLRDLTIPLLLENSGLYAGQAVRLRGELLMSRDSAVLVERLGPGGVPAAEARQVKLAAPPRDEALLARLQRGASEGVRFGPVQITGLWQGGRLYPLAVEAGG